MIIDTCFMLHCSCVDYVAVERSAGGESFGATESCGQQADDNMLRLNTSVSVHCIVFNFSLKRQW